MKDGGRRITDVERMMLAGCLAFTLASVIQYASVAVPYTVSDRIHTTSDVLRLAVGTGLLSLVVGCAFAWLCRLAGLAGTVAGLLPAGVFVWLRLWSLLQGVPGVPGFEPAQFPSVLAWILPIAHGGVVALAAIITLRLRSAWELRTGAGS